MEGRKWRWDDRGKIWLEKKEAEEKRIGERVETGWREKRESGENEECGGRAARVDMEWRGKSKESDGVERERKTEAERSEDGWSEDRAERAGRIEIGRNGWSWRRNGGCGEKAERVDRGKKVETEWKDRK